MAVDWPEPKDNLVNLCHVPRLIVSRTNRRKLLLTENTMKYLGWPNSIEATINPAKAQIKITPGGQYPIGGKDSGAQWAVNVPDMLFMQPGTYIPTKEINVYEWGEAPRRKPRKKK